MTKNSEKKEMNATNPLAIERRDPKFWREAWQQARLVFYLLRDPEVPFYLKFLPFLALVYVISPVDFIPNAVLPVVGTLDDVTALLVGAKVFIELAPPHVVIKHLNVIRQQDGFPPIAEDDTAVDQHIIDGEIIEEKDAE